MHPEFHILLIDDSLTDIKIIERALREGRVDHRLTVLHDGTQALAYLMRLREPSAPDDLTPDLILLDLNLPRVDGREVLQEIKSDPELRRIPVVVLTTSQADEDIVRSYNLHANAYVTKPVDFDRFIAAVRQIDEFFVSVVKLPPRG